MSVDFSPASQQRQEQSCFRKLFLCLKEGKSRKWPYPGTFACGAKSAVGCSGAKSGHFKYKLKAGC
jgi:hypothetical protein